MKGVCGILSQGLDEDPHPQSNSTLPHISVVIAISTAEGILILLFLWRNNSHGGALEKSKEEIWREKEEEGGTGQRERMRMNVCRKFIWQQRM